MEFITTLRFFGDLNRLKQHNNKKNKTTNLIITKPINITGTIRNSLNQFAPSSFTLERKFDALSGLKCSQNALNIAG